MATKQAGTSNSRNESATVLLALYGRVYVEGQQSVVLINTGDEFNFPDLVPPYPPTEALD
jgi:hypothetical protein